jgi:three-Cys-motif partner protein
MLVDCRLCIQQDKHALLCPHIVGHDRLPVRCVGKWAKDKHFYLSRYIDMLTTSMKNKWEKTAYVELFSGPGECVVRNTVDIIDGSPLVALKSPLPFSEYHFVELDQPSLNVLENRCNATGLGSRCNFYLGDCNVEVGNVVKNMSDDALGLAFIDPTGAHIDFNTIEELTAGRRMDLIITFPLSMDIRRNIAALAEISGPNRLDRFMGSNDWRQIYDDFASGKISSMSRPLIDVYKSRLKSIGYIEVASAEDDILIRGGDKKVPLYHILFACKHRLGAKFWHVSTKETSDGQMTLPFATG